MKIIAFGHRKRTGKDTAVKFCLSFARQYYPHLQCYRLSFGDQIKKISVQMLAWGGLQDAVYYENHPEEREVVLPAIGLSPRQIWDEMGTFGAKLCPKVWPEMSLQNIEADVLFCGDLRRLVEVDYVKKFSGLCFKINREAAPISNHVVDTSLADFLGWDGQIENNNGLKEFNHKIKKIVIAALNPTQEQGHLVCPSCYSRGKAVMKSGGMFCLHCEGAIDV